MQPVYSRILCIIPCSGRTHPTLVPCPPRPSPPPRPPRTPARRLRIDPGVRRRARRLNRHRERPAPARRGGGGRRWPTPSFEDSIWHFSGVPPSCRAAAEHAETQSSSLVTGASMVAGTACIKPPCIVGIDEAGRGVRFRAHGLRRGVLVL